MSNLQLLEQVRGIWPGLTTLETDILLWSCTKYPEASNAEVLADLKSVYKTSGGDLWLALEQADKQRIELMTGERGD